MDQMNRMLCNNRVMKVNVIDAIFIGSTNQQAI